MLPQKKKNNVIYKQKFWKDFSKNIYKVLEINCHKLKKKNINLSQ